MIDEQLKFLYEETVRSLKAAAGEAETLPFTCEEVLDVAGHHGMDNSYDFQEMTEGGLRAFARRVYLCAFRRVPDEHALDGLDEKRTPEEAAQYRGELIRHLSRSEEAREKDMLIRHNPLDRRNAARRLQKEGGGK